LTLFSLLQQHALPICHGKTFAVMMQLVSVFSALAGLTLPANCPTCEVAEARGTGNQAKA
jgi:hypothetical protein